MAIIKPITNSPLVRSFDLFDTLAGRLHYLPESIFHLVEKRFPFPGFSFYRMAAECRSDRTLPDIYRQFQKLTGLPDTQAAALMRFEFETELAHIFPISENVNLIKDGDLIVSDTYYDTDQIKILLDTLGLRCAVHVYASPRGKSSGAAWAILKNIHRIESHLGDSEHSDVAMAKRQGIEAIHYTNSALSSEEQHLCSMGQSELGYLCRALRLSNPYAPQSLEWLLWNDQCKFNVPILIQASLYLHDFCQTHGKKRILFTSRDGCLWIQIFRQMFPQYDSIYFHASRHVYRYATPSFVEYVKNLYTEDTVITDSHGRGCSSELFFRTHLHVESTYLAIINIGSNHHAILRSNSVCEHIEMLNYDTCGALYDVQNGEPLRCEPEYPLKYVLPMHACIKKCLELLPFFSKGALDVGVIEWAVKSMQLADLTIRQHFLHARYHCHISDDTNLHHFHIKHLD